jgi:hypothetical protein
VVLRGCFHPFAGAPRVPMARLHVDLRALSLKPHLEPDDRKQMVSVLHACNPPSHSQYHRHVTLTNLYNTPLTYVVCAGGMTGTRPAGSGGGGWGAKRKQPE